MKIKSPLLYALLLAFSANVFAQEIIVTPEDNQGWFGRVSNTGTFAEGPVDSNGDAGSLGMLTDGSDGQIIKAARIPLIRINGITEICWEVYTDNAVNYPRPQLEYFGSGRSGTLDFLSSNRTPVLDTWESYCVDFDNDSFRSSETQETMTLAEWQASDVGPILMNYFQLGFGSTGGVFPATNSAIDYVTLNSDTWAFGQVTSLPLGPPQYSVPTLSQWGLIFMALVLLGFAFTRRKHFG